MRLFRVPTDEGHGAAPTNLNLTQRQYENDVSSSTSPWLALQAQRLSVAVHIASAELRRGRSATEIYLSIYLSIRDAQEMQLSLGRVGRGGGGERRSLLCHGVSRCLM